MRLSSDLLDRLWKCLCLQVGYIARFCGEGRGQLGPGGKQTLCSSVNAWGSVDFGDAEICSCALDPTSVNELLSHREELRVPHAPGRRE